MKPLGKCSFFIFDLNGKLRSMVFMLNCVKCFFKIIFILGWCYLRHQWRLWCIFCCYLFIVRHALKLLISQLMWICKTLSHYSHTRRTDLLNSADTNPWGIALHTAAPHCVSSARMWWCARDQHSANTELSTVKNWDLPLSETEVH